MCKYCDAMHVYYTKNKAAGWQKMKSMVIADGRTYKSHVIKA